MSDNDEKTSKRAELKKLHFQKSQELKKAKSRADKEKIELKYRELEEVLVGQVVPTEAVTTVVPESLYGENQTISRSQAKKEAKLVKDAQRRAELIAIVGDGSIESELAKAEMSAILNRIPNGYRISEVPADGDCLFTSIQLQLESSMPLRSLVADYLEAQAEEFTHFVEGDDFNEYCLGVRSSAWGSDIELEILSRILRRRILIYTPDRVITMGEEFPEEATTIRISFHERQYSSPHYNALVSS